MRIGLHDADATGFPNLAPMKWLYLKVMELRLWFKRCELVIDSPCKRMRGVYNTGKRRRG